MVEPFDENAELARLRANRDDGASEIARAALQVLARASTVGRDRHELALLAGKLADTRPSMTPLIVLMRRFQERLGQGEAPDLIVQDLQNESETAVLKAGQNVAALIEPGVTLLTHSLSSTVLKTVELAARHVNRVIVTEGRPLCEGLESARRVAALGVKVTLITDAIGAATAGEADIVLLGADTVLSDGSVINKAGSYGLALAAHRAGIPLIVVCESAKRRPSDLPPPELEEMNANELGHPATTGVTMRNVYFDVTPAALVTRIVDEDG